MNKTINQSGEIIINVGQLGSHIRNKETYNITLPKLIKMLNDNWARGGLARHTDHRDMENILFDDDISPLDHDSIIRSAYYYSDLNKDGRIN